MSKGFLIFAQNTDSVDYLQQAYCLALSIKHSQRIVDSVSLVTNDVVPDQYSKVFDHIIPIPWTVEIEPSRFMGEHRWKLYHVSPYEETIVLDSDMLVLEDLSTWWDQCKNYDVNFCSRVLDHKLDLVTSDFYRKSFTENKLSNPYYALHYFKKSEKSYEFYKVLEFVCNNWEWCYSKFASEKYQNRLSMDLATAISIEIIGNLQFVDNASPLEFIHMKPEIQGWEIPTVHWQDSVFSLLNSKGDLIVGNIKQSKIFHYVEKDFINTKIIKTLEELVYGKEK